MISLLRRKIYFLKRSHDITHDEDGHNDCYKNGKNGKSEYVN